MVTSLAHVSFRKESRLKEEHEKAQKEGNKGCKGRRRDIAT
jgi:hypothetical protein